MIDIVNNSSVANNSRHSFNRKMQKNESQLKETFQFFEGQSLRERDENNHNEEAESVFESVIPSVNLEDNPTVE